MKKLLLILVAGLMLSACESMPLKATKKIPNARITWYHNHEDKWGSKTACGVRAREGVTVAAHPHFDFGTKLEIPALKSILGSSHFLVQDRGSAVTSKKASVAGEYVFDIYLAANSRREGKNRVKHMGSELTHADVFVE